MGSDGGTGRGGTGGGLRRRRRLGQWELRARARARRLVTGGSVLHLLDATRAPGTDAGHEQGRFSCWWLTALVAQGAWAHGNGGGSRVGGLVEM